jgi:ribosomal protein S18 acetylase RimI-like enzyme
VNTDGCGGADCTVRPGRPGDVEALLTLWREAGSEPSVGENPDAVDPLLTRSDTPVLVAEDGGNIVGSLFACWDGWRGNMYRLAVAPQHRRRGIALRLVAEGERRLRELGARRIAAIVVSAADPAVGFWRAAGYHADDRVARFVKNVASVPGEV